MSTEVQTTHPAVLPAQDDRLTAIVELAKQMVALTTRIQNGEALLKQLKEQLKLIAEGHLPELMGQIGLSELSLTDGQKIKIRPEFYGSVAQNRMDQAVAWLEEHNMAGIVKKDYTLDASALSQEELNAAIERLPIAVKRTIHPSTLRSFVKERFEANDPDFPRELFAASQVNRAVLSDGS